MQGIVASADKKVIFIASPGDGKQFLRKHLNVFITEGYSSQIKNLDWIDAVISNPTSIEQLLATETREGDLKEKKRSLIARNEHGIVPNEYFDTENRLLIDNPLLSFITNNRVREYAKQVSKERSIREYNLFIQTLISITRFGIRELFLSTPERDSLEKSIALLGHPLEISSLKIPKGLKINYEVVFSLIDEQAFYLKEFYLKHPSIPHDMLDVSDHPIFKESTILTRKRGGLHIIPKSKGRNPLESDISIPVEFVSIDPEEAAAMLGVAHYTMHPERIPKYAFGLRIRGADTPFSLVSFDPMDRNFKEDLVALSGLDPKKALELTKLYDVDNCPIKSASELFNMAIASKSRQIP